jgi:hypothetical protein
MECSGILEISSHYTSQASKWTCEITNYKTSHSGVMKSSTSWDIAPCSPLKVNRPSGGTCCLHLRGWRSSRARNQWEGRRQAGLKVEVTWFSKTSVGFQLATWHNIPKGRTLKQSVCCTTDAMLKEKHCQREVYTDMPYFVAIHESVLRGLSPRANYTDRATAACRRS